MDCRRHQMVLCLLLPSLFTLCNSIRCYDCNSRNNTMCLDPTLYDRETVEKYLITTDCTQGAYSHHNKEFFCRKIVQIILHKDHDSEVRVTRGCGWVRHSKDCYKSDNEDHMETVCQCFNNECNSATGLTGLTYSLVGMTSLSVLILKF